MKRQAITRCHLFLGRVGARRAVPGRLSHTMGTARRAPTRERPRRLYLQDQMSRNARLLCVLGAAFLCGTIAAGEPALKAPAYKKGENFVETVTALRAPYTAWWNTLPTPEKQRLRKAWWSDPAHGYRGQVARDFPAEWNALRSDAGYRKRTFQFHAWFRAEALPDYWFQVVKGYVESQKKLGVADDESIAALFEAMKAAPEGQDAAAVRARLYVFANAVRYLQALELEKKSAYARSIADRLLTTLPTGSPLREVIAERRIMRRLGEGAAAITAWRTDLLKSVAEVKLAVLDLPAAAMQDARDVHAQALALLIRSHGTDEIVFAVRTKVSGYYHWYESFGYTCDNPDKWNFQYGGRLVALDLRTGKTRDIFADEQGAVRDPAMSYDGRKILFSYRPADTRYFHLYEINADGTGMKRLTDGKFDDIEPTYLPSGDIMFCSSRARRWVPCLNAPVANLYKCKADGSGIEAVSANVETENTPCVLPDGRVLFMRWEYVERDRGVPHGLWSINPDGTGQMAFWGNMNEPDVFIDARPIPGTDRVIYVAHPHGSADHVGSVATLSPNDGPDEHGSIKWITPNVRLARTGYRDPYPIAESVYLVAQMGRLLVYDDDGRFAELFSINERAMVDGKPREVWLHEPRAVRIRKREPVIHPRVDPTRPTTGSLILADVTEGRRMEGVKPGDVKKLLVLEVTPKPVHHDGHTETISWNGSFFIERVLGTVPVEPDGSAHFEAPAMRCLFFVALDADGNSIKRMQSFVSLRPGETVGCVGCHENRTQVSPRKTHLQALKKPAAAIAPMKGIPSVYHFPRDIQPILNRHCVKCHDDENRSGGVVLNDDVGPWFTQSYITLKTRRQYAGGYGGVAGWGNAAPRTQGAGVSELMKKIDPRMCGGKTHHGVALSQQEQDVVRYWIESWSQYSGTYASLNNDPNKRIFVDKDILKRRCASCHTDNFNMRKHAAPSHADLRESMGMRINFSHPERSLMLRAPLAKEAGGLAICRARKATGMWDTVDGEKVRWARNWNLGNAPVEAIFKSKDDPDYQKILAGIREAAKEQMKGRLERPGFIPNEHYVREMKKHGLLPKEFNPVGKDIKYYFEVDDAYYRMFWPGPKGQ
jgi:hydrazine synthase alpha subunit-like protein